MESRKMMLMNLFAQWQERHRHREQTCGCSGGMRGLDNWERSIETYTLPYVKQIAIGNLLYDAVNSNLELCDNLEG